MAPITFEPLLRYDGALVDVISSQTSRIPHGKAAARAISKTIHMGVTIAMACLIGAWYGPLLMMAFLLRWSLVTVLSLGAKDLARWSRPSGASLQEFGNPSTHTALASSLLQGFLPTYVSAGWCAAMALARVGLYEHYVTDVVVGGLFGWTISSLLPDPFVLAAGLSTAFRLYPLICAILFVTGGFLLHAVYLVALMLRSGVRLPDPSLIFRPKQLGRLFRLPSGRSVGDVMLGAIGPNVCIAACGLALYWAPLSVIRPAAKQILSLVAVWVIAGVGCILAPPNDTNKLPEVVIVALALACCVWLLG